MSEVVSRAVGEKLDAAEMKQTVENAVKEVVRERVAEMLNESEDE